MSEHASTCVHCGQPVAPDDGGSIWYHTETMEAFCDPEGEHRIDRQAEPAEEVFTVTLAMTREVSVNPALVPDEFRHVGLPKRIADWPDELYDAIITQLPQLEDPRTGPVILDLTTIHYGDDFSVDS